MRRGFESLLHHLQDGIERALLRGTARAERHGDELRVERLELRASRAQFLDSFLRFRREKLEEEFDRFHGRRGTRAQDTRVLRSCADQGSAPTAARTRCCTESSR